MGRKAVDFCSGGGGIAIALVEEGFDYVAGLDYDPSNPYLSHRIAEVHRLNFHRGGCLHHSITLQDAAKIDFEMMPNDVFIAHGSPPCPNFSNAKTNATETETDIAIASAVALFITLKQPRFFTLEQVPAYVRSQSWQIIKDALLKTGYGISFDILNAQDYNVPQDRERLIVIADRDGRALGMPAKCQRQGWWSVLGDRIPNMQSGKLTASQQRDLDEVRSLYPATQAFLIQRVGARNGSNKVRHQFDPCFTLTKSMFTDGKGANRQQFLDIWYKGQVKTLAIADVARLQTFPDWYQWSGNNLVDGAIIGNSVPPNLYREVLKHVKLFC